ncbi:cell growth-regulating nucleolar protein-like [Mizuhopecten yessoensis]|uniref:Cell growth-regulating nucleolar protein n=1 Tax=Mizuhopecten yessoensis TaxID=6573 RepID=A0A210QLB0_MIZYE|nr:cell growth-regulating nucleolar protein-like [Mizuhopecten yessoensis]OWF49528.1 Cell growth-regulating nucleolar protein [Mizuhopecten yessoensis]
MVVFTCNACGDSLKKNQVESHYLGKCRRCEVVSCVDCGKDFWGNDYQSHIKCISEEEKYSGKNYKPKANANKGDAKQELWLQQVQDAIDKCSANAQLKGLLERMKDYPNIPRKRAKFENFVGNSLNTRNNYLINQAWDLLMENTAKNKPPEKKSVENGQANGMSQSATEKSDENSKPTTEEEQCEERKLSKREKKEERSKKHNKKEKKDRHEQSENVDCEKSKKKKSKKRKREEEEEEECNEEEQPTKIKKKKRSKKENADESISANPNIEEEEDTEESPAKRGTKFDWVEVITSLLQSKGEITLKKLRKKVLAEYLSQGGRAMTEEKLGATFTKKVTKNPTFVVHKERVKLRDRK